MKANIKKYALIGVCGLVVLGLLWFTTVTVNREVSKYTNSWKEVQFAKDHPALVGMVREKYELGLKALDMMTSDDIKALSPLATPEQSK